LKIRVRYYTTLRELAGSEEEEFELETHSVVGALVETVSEKYGVEAYNYLHVSPGGNLDPAIKFLINGRDIRRLDGFETVLRDGDVVAFIPPIGGG
jgi:molybdopterin synthase sulfur carrier subunit